LLRTVHCAGSGGGRWELLLPQSCCNHDSCCWRRASSATFGVAISRGRALLPAVTPALLRTSAHVLTGVARARVGALGAAAAAAAKAETPTRGVAATGARAAGRGRGGDPSPAEASEAGFRQQTASSRLRAPGGRWSDQGHPTASTEEHTEWRGGAQCGRKAPNFSKNINRLVVRRRITGIRGFALLALLYRRFLVRLLRGGGFPRPCAPPLRPLIFIPPTPSCHEAPV
jgi:hypothetical protein